MSQSSDTPDEPTRHNAVDRHAEPVMPGRVPLEPKDVEGDLAPEDLDGEVGAEGGSKSPNHKVPMPWVPAKDGTALGDTDQHSNA